MKEMKEIELDISIDRDALDREWDEQSCLYFRYAMMLADARQELDTAKTELDLVQAELDQSIRADPEAFDIAKLTEGAVKAAILIQKEYKKAAKQLADAKHLVDVLGAAVGALDHRKSALSKLVELWICNYFSEPRTSGVSQEHVDHLKKKMMRRGRERTD